MAIIMLVAGRAIHVDFADAQLNLRDVEPSKRRIVIEYASE